MRTARRVCWQRSREACFLPAPACLLTHGCCGSQRIFRGHVVGWRDIAAQSAVPALHWFVADPEKARWDEATPGSIAFDAGHGIRYYDAVEVHRQGSSRHDGAVRQEAGVRTVKSKDWPKRKYEVHFTNKRFAWAPGAPAVRRVSLRSMYQARACHGRCCG